MHPVRESSAFRIAAAEPRYLRLGSDGVERRAEEALKHLAACDLCPRRCGVNRLEGRKGRCLTGRYASVASAGPHFGEEDCLRGRRGSGTIFFRQCSLRCAFCQNWDISQAGESRPTCAEELAALMLMLQERGCHNINLVTPEHVTPQILEGLALAIAQGLRLPLVYNTSAYVSLETLRLLEEVVDVYMPDFKFWRPETAARLCCAEDYPQRAREAIREMHRQVGVLRFDAQGIACRGVLVRHLVMPGQIDESAAIFRFLAGELSPDTFVNVMPQYHPDHKVSGRWVRGGRRSSQRYGAECRRITASEFEAALAAARDAGLARFAAD